MRLVFGLCCLVFLAGCAPRVLNLPTGSGTPLADFAPIHADIAKACAGIRTLTAELAISGRAGEQKLRGRALAGFEAPEAMRLEGLAPFGPPAFILAARPAQAILLLPRDHRVLRGATAREILGALTGVSLAPGDLQAVLSGCVVGAPQAVSGAQHGADWRTIELRGDARLYLQRSGNAWQLRAATRDGWSIEYPTWQGAWPQVVRLKSEQQPAVDLSVEISQIETNLPIDDAAFTIDVPRDAQPMTLAELREAGPLSGTFSR